MERCPHPRGGSARRDQSPGLAVAGLDGDGWAACLDGDGWAACLDGDEIWTSWNYKTAPVLFTVGGRLCQFSENLDRKMLGAKI